VTEEKAMLIGEHKQRNISAELSEREKERICDFIQGSVYCFCKNNPDEWFAARDLFGGVNYSWSATALESLYDWHENSGASEPVKSAGKDIGWLLLRVLSEDKRIFEKRKGYMTNEYKWVVEK
jgi:hypothetical protein